MSSCPYDGRSPVGDVDAERDDDGHHQQDREQDGEALPEPFPLLLLQEGSPLLEQPALGRVQDEIGAAVDATGL